MNLLRLEEVAQQLGISYTQARVLVLHDEKIPHVTIGARGVRVDAEDLKKYVEGLQKEGKSGSTDVREDRDTREPYTGRRVLPDNTGGDKAAGNVEGHS